MVKIEEESLPREYATRWKRVGPLLEAQREEDVRRSDTVSNVAAFTRLCAEAVRNSPLAITSGLVEQQRLFQKLLTR